MPYLWSAVAYSGDYIYVAEYGYPSIYIHSWQGKELAKLTYTTLQLRMHDQVFGLRCVQDRFTLILAAGDDKRVRSLHAYKVSVWCRWRIRKMVVLVKWI